MKRFEEINFGYKKLVSGIVGIVTGSLLCLGRSVSLSKAQALRQSTIWRSWNMVYFGEKLGEREKRKRWSEV